MSTSKMIASIFLMSAVASALADLAMCQQAPPRQGDQSPPPQISQPSRDSQLQSGRTLPPRAGDAQQNTANANHDVDRYLASCLLGQNQSEVALARIAQQKAESREVQEFAKMMIEDHGQMIQQLQRLATGQPAGQNSSNGSRQPGTAGQPGTGAGIEVNPPGTGVSVNVGGAQSAGGGQETDQLIVIDKQVGERCTQLLRQELEDKSGREFDKCYIGGKSQHISMH